MGLKASASCKHTIAPHLPLTATKCVSMETLNHFITVLFAFLSSSYHFFHYLKIPPGIYRVFFCNLHVFNSWLWKYTLNGKFEVVLMYNLHEIINYLWSLHAFSSSLLAFFLLGRKGKPWLTARFMLCNYGSWQGRVKWNDWWRGVFGEIFSLSHSLSFCTDHTKHVRQSHQHAVVALCEW